MCTQSTNNGARPAWPRRAFSLLEMMLVLAVLGLLSTMAVTRFGHGALAVTDGEGLARQLTLDLRQARRRTITTGVDHYVQFNRSGGAVVGFVLCRSGGDPEDDTRPIPAGLTVATASDTWTFGFDGALQGVGGSTAATITSDTFQWVVTCYHPTGLVECVKQAAP
ncbi:hypothetical protein Pla123a_46940 [Posidoniimonas polymericola]|uniref:General secretion pathway GspH domain-containing protein n=1 Tax=Posidoniimonas polymericola TaxID=2528002 RepID=A0A5C5XTP2_9BACT|nr:type II secretion system protein [Posidoniimonas polymericola]TWT66300.1 hypothetical protein Pla123a_46940 [Posidoniimonas polymericola]